MASTVLKYDWQVVQRSVCQRDGRWFLKLLQAETDRMEGWCRQMELDQRENALPEDSKFYYINKVYITEQSLDYRNDLYLSLLHYVKYKEASMCSVYYIVYIFTGSVYQYVRKLDCFHYWNYALNVKYLIAVWLLKDTLVFVLVVLGKMRSAVGSAQLLISQKFQQFRELCEENLVSKFYCLSQNIKLFLCDSAHL